MKKSRKKEDLLDQLSGKHMDYTIEMAEYGRILVETQSKMRILNRKIQILEAQIERIESDGNVN